MADLWKVWCTGCCHPSPDVIIKLAKPLLRTMDKVCHVQRTVRSEQIIADHVYNHIANEEINPIQINLVISLFLSIMMFSSFLLGLSLIFLILVSCSGKNTEKTRCASIKLGYFLMLYFFLFNKMARLCDVPRHLPRCKKRK